MVWMPKCSLLAVIAPSRSLLQNTVEFKRIASIACATTIAGLIIVQLSQNVEVLQHHGGQWHPTWIFPDDSLQWIQLSLLTKILLMAAYQCLNDLLLNRINDRYSTILSCERFSVHSHSLEFESSFSFPYYLVPKTHALCAQAIFDACLCMGRSDH